MGASIPSTDGNRAARACVDTGAVRIHPVQMNIILALVMLAALAACPGPTAAPTEDTYSSGDTECTPGGEPLLGEARIVCAPGTLEPSGACTASEATSIRQTLTCEDYASVGDQRLEQEYGTCALAAGSECCACSFDLDATCDPCETND